MSTYETAYCSESDLQSIVPNIADYDRKRTITGWSTYSGSTYQSGSSGAIDQCYRDGLELTSVADRATLHSNAADGEYFYDSSLMCYMYTQRILREHLTLWKGARIGPQSLLKP